MQTITLKDILTDKQCEDVSRYINNKDWKGLKKYLRSLKKQLLLYDVLPDYLYHYLKNPEGVNRLLEKLE